MPPESRAATDVTFLASTAAGADRLADDPIFALNAEAKRRAQSGESILNATLGSLLADDGTLAVLPVVVEALARVPAQAAAAYAPIAGEPRFLHAVATDLFGGGPLASDAIAVATPGGSGALHHAVCNFLEPGQALLTTDHYWGPYATIAHHLGRRVATFRMLDANGAFDAAAFEAALHASIDEQGRALVLFNFPCHNPTGFALDDREWADAAAIVREAAGRAPVAFLLDFAYARFGEPQCRGFFDNAQRIAERALLLVAWTASKSFAQYGARIGALVAVHSSAAERKRMSGALSFSCRGTWSNCNHGGMLAITDVLEDAALRARADAERRERIALLDARVRAFTAAAKAAGLRHPRYASGFFVTVFAADGEEAARRMRGEGVFVVPMQGAVRVALCSTPERDVPRLVKALAAATRARPAGA